MECPDPTGRPLLLTCERQQLAPPAVIYAAWTTDQIERWFAAPGTSWMKPEVGAPYFFETHFEGRRHPHHGRFLKLEPAALVELSWLTAAGTEGTETVLSIELTPASNGSLLRLTHSGFPDEESRSGHADAWPLALEYLDNAFSGSR
jgi:uncharacterized protein YndB with AHSA1/START domain